MSRGIVSSPVVDDVLLGRARRCLADPAVRAIDADVVERLARALDDPRRADGLVAAGRHGALALFLPDAPPGPRRRMLELDRAGAVVAALRWSASGALASAVVRTGGDEWIGVEPGVARHAAWGTSDQVWRMARGPRWQPLEPLSVFASIDWAAITHVPPLAEPARLPPGAGTAVLNVVAALAKDQGTPRVRYRGPFPTEQLFTALLECFRFDAGVADPLGAFVAGDLEWSPAPHERHFTAPGVCAQLRERLEKVTLDGRTYYRHDWQSVRRHAPRRVHDVGDRVHCSLWALGAAVADHAILSRAGEVVSRISPPDPSRPSQDIPDAVRDGVAAVLCATSAPALGEEIHRLVTATPLRWAAVRGDLVSVDRGTIRFSWRLAETAAARFRAASTPHDRLARGLELLAEMAALIGDAVRARAQSSLAQAPQEAQERALRAEPRNDAAVIARSAEAVVAAVETLT